MATSTQPIRRKYAQLGDVMEYIVRIMNEAGYLQEEGAASLLNRLAGQHILPLCKGQRPQKRCGKVNYYASFHSHCLNPQANWRYNMQFDPSSVTVETTADMPKWHSTWILSIQDDEDLGTMVFTDLRELCEYLSSAYPDLTGIQRTAVIWNHFMNKEAKVAWRNSLDLTTDSKACHDYQEPVAEWSEAPDQAALNTAPLAPAPAPAPAPKATTAKRLVIRKRT
jgi:hypothetical protein